MEFDEIIDKGKLGLITYMEVVIDGHTGVYFNIPPGISSPAMLVEKSAAFVFFISGEGTMYADIRVGDEIIQHDFNLPSNNPDNLEVVLGKGTSFGFRSGDDKHLEVVILDP